MCRTQWALTVVMWGVRWSRSRSRSSRSCRERGVIAQMTSVPPAAMST
ncbi:hypothetical protein ABZ839_01785 [Streptomyces cellulosae]